jgi:hypothetical protein
MFARVTWLVVSVMVGALLGSCAFVDQYSPRAYQSNLNLQDTSNQEALLNVVRASRYEALSFISVASTSGSQTETLNTGLPAFTLGPGQTVAQKQFVFGGNSVSSNAMGSFQVNTLVSSPFIQGMLTPITPKVLALLIGTYPREWMYYATIDGIKMTSANSDVAFYLRNDPADDRIDGVQAYDECEHILDRTPVGTGIYTEDGVCNFSKFANILGLAVEFGLTAEIQLPSATAQKGAAPPPAGKGGTNSPGAAQTPSATTNTTATPTSTGHLCWDPVLALQKYRKIVLKQMTNICGNPASASQHYTFRFSNMVFSDVEFVFRSPYGIYRYLGQILRENSAGSIHFKSAATLEERELNSGPFLNISEGDLGGCLIEAFYNGQSYCVPRQGSSSTATLFDVLAQLKNLSTAPSDLNAAFAVRVVN